MVENKYEQALLSLLRNCTLVELVAIKQAEYEVTYGKHPDVIFLHWDLRAPFIREMYRILKIKDGEVLSADAVVFNKSILRFFYKRENPIEAMQVPYIRLRYTGFPVGENMMEISQ
jgi:hypothetical protein